VTDAQPGPERPTSPVSGLPSSPELKARIADFMERSGELLAHELATYKAPYKMNVIRNTVTGQTSFADFDHNLLPKEQLVYFATIERPILFTEGEPTYIRNLIAALGREHPALRPYCGEMSKRFKNWQKTLLVGVKSSAGIPDRAIDGWQLDNVWAAPVGTPLPAHLNEDELIEDFYFARIYLNGFVWHNDPEKTAEYRAASELMQLHYRKCAELRVFSGLQQVLAPIHQFFLDTRDIGEDL
jgi:hypothetical protein